MLEELLVAPDSSIREVMNCIDRNAQGIALVVDRDRRLLGTITDGDIRRAILAGIDLSIQVTGLLKRKADSPYPRPITAPVGTGHPDLLRSMRQHGIRHIPLVDENGRVVDLTTLEDLAPVGSLPINAAIMAGGYGTRLRPLTDETPKPMLPIGGRPIMEWIIEGLRQAGIRRITLTTHYRAEAITEHFGDGRDLGVQIEYIHEEQLSGTAGSLGLLHPWSEPLLVINGDILTQVDFRAMLHYHEEQKADMTVAVREYHFRVPYGIVEMEDVRIRGLTEKPTLPFFVNAGIYLLDPVVRSCITKGEFLDMTDLIMRLLDDGQSVVGFPVREYWIDIGQIADYERAQTELEETATE